MGKYYLGVDVGTSGLKSLLITRGGKIIAEDTQEYPLYWPRPGFSEQDPQDWWRATVRGVRAVINKAEIDGKSIAGIGLSGQMHGSVFLDDTHKPLRRAILWNDQRTAKQCRYIERAAGGKRRLIAMVGNPALTGFTAPKIIWVRDNQKTIYKHTKHVLLPKDYIRLRLTGQYATEVSDASGTLLLDVKRRIWSKPLLARLKIDPSWMPRCYESVQISGSVMPRIARQLGISRDTPVVGGAGDQPAGAIGNGIVKPGIVSATLGTSGVVLAYSDKPQIDPAGRVHTMCHAVPGKWCIFGCMLAAGGSFQWFKNTLGQEEIKQAAIDGVDPYQLLIEQARRANAGCEGLFFLPYLTGERTPHADPYARAGWVGIPARTDRAMLARAVLEGVTLGMRDQIQIMRQLGIKVRQVRAAGGGARSAWWRQLQADIYNSVVVMPSSTEAAALGAAILAAVGTGAYKSVPQACQHIIKTARTSRPNPKLVKLYEKHYKVFVGLYGSLKDDFARMARLVQQ